MTGWLALLAEVFGATPDLVWKVSLVFLRVGAAAALLPAFGEQTLSVRVRLVAAVAFTAIVAPAVFEALPGADSGVLLPAAVEVLTGLALGLGLRLIVLTLQIAGTIAAQAMSLSQLTAYTGPEPMPALSQFLTMAALALAAALGLHVKFAEFLALSFEIVPSGLPISAEPFAKWGVEETGRMFALAFALAAPFQVASVLYNLALGFISRAMPQLMITMIGAPALTLGGIALLALVSPVLLSVWLLALQAGLAVPFEAAP